VAGKDDDLEIPPFLKRSGDPRPPRAYVSQERVIKSPRDCKVSGDPLIPEALAEELEAKRLRNLQKFKNRISRTKSGAGKQPPHTVWDVRTGRWVFPVDLKTSLSDVLAGGPTTREIMERIRKERAMSKKPDFSAMSGRELLTAYNALAATPRKSKFESKADGVAACEEMWKNSQYAEAASAKQRQISAAPEDRRDPDAPKRQPAKPPKAPMPPAAPSEANKGSKKLLMKIVRVTQKNPRREGTAAHRHFEEMETGRTVADYLSVFDPEDRRTAAQWLSNTVREGHVRVEE